MPRALSKIEHLEELNSRLETIIRNLHNFGGRLANVYDKRDIAKNIKPGEVSHDRPRNAFIVELDSAVNKLSENLGYLDGLVIELENEFFGMPDAPGTGVSVREGSR